ncbi:RNase H domain-containing protein [Caerostris darwini]|uniref:RNase H domain-containing protein n=1 Tax=Caerostris darwini TaxID=1538125 RepID=A0AAV4UQI9_9ARAC|nr:RNase H domain-containing protein [Caerostris darwini]
MLQNRYGGLWRPFITKLFAVKTSPIDATLLGTGNYPLEKIIEEKGLVLWEKITRTPRYLNLWNLESPRQRCLKIQTGYLQEVLKLKDPYNLNFEFENLPTSRSPLDCRIFNVVTNLFTLSENLILAVMVLGVFPIQLLTSYIPEPEWLRIYTDGSCVEQRIDAGAGAFCDLFSVNVAVSHFSYAYNGKSKLYVFL